MDRSGRLHQGFTLIEMMVTLAIIAIIATMVVPLTQLVVQRNKEGELRENLRELRGAIDAYKAAWDEGRITRRIDESGYPPTLRILVDGVADARDPTMRTLRFLRRLPRDPFADSDIPAEKTWGKRSYVSEPDQPREGADVYDVYSLAPGVGLNSQPYRLW